MYSNKVIIILIILLYLCIGVSFAQRTVAVTVYHAVEEQCDSTPDITASGFKIDLSNPYAQRIIAISRDLKHEFPFGTKVRIAGIGKYSGIWTVQDVMNKRWTNKIDLLINPGMRQGSWKNIKIYKYAD